MNFHLVIIELPVHKLHPTRNCRQLGCECHAEQQKVSHVIYFSSSVQNIYFEFATASVISCAVINFEEKKNTSK